jgi:hypothetical protein
MGPSDPPPKFDYDAYLAWVSAYPHNFFRLWTWELITWDTAGNREQNAQVHRAFPHPWKRTGPGNALDGKPKFDLTQFDDEYFNRLRTRVKAAQDRGIYASIMLFEGWGMQFSPNAWKMHPFHPDNNINGINGDLDGDGKGLEVHTGASRQVTDIQRAYVRKVIDTVNDLDAVLYEISNENHPPSTQWQYDMIRFIHQHERTKPKQHPVGMTFQYKAGANKALFDSPADWISPNPDGGYRDVFMDPYDGKVLSKSQDLKWTEPIRKAMGVALDLSRRVDLATLAPHPELSSSKYCLANPGREYLIYVPTGEEVTVDLTPAVGALAVQWINPIEGKPASADMINGGAKRTLKSPFKDGAVLHLRVR